MAEPTTLNETTRKPWRPERWMFYAAVAAAVGCLIWALVSMGAAGRARSDADQRVAAIQKEAQSQIEAAHQEGLQHTVEGIATALEPVSRLSSQVPEITERTFQSVTRSMLDRGGYRFVAITDSKGTILASSDLALIGESLPSSPPGNMSAKAQIGRDPVFGTIVLTTQ